MASNAFGNIFKITTWGESHGEAIGVVIDGCPAGLPIAKEYINEQLARRSPGKNPCTSPRQEKDEVQILSGLFDGRTTGAPICLMIRNMDQDSGKYTPIQNLLRPGHANFTYLEKYGVFDFRGGGRASARETAARVAAGAVAKVLLQTFDIQIFAYIKQIGPIRSESLDWTASGFKDKILENPVFCPDPEASQKMVSEIEKMKLEGDSLGGMVEVLVTGLPAGLGDPVYEKFEANMAKIMLSLPAAKGFEFGSGFQAAAMKGSEHNDIFHHEEGQVRTKTNHAGGTLGGISTGMPFIARVAFKPASSIAKSQPTLDTNRQAAAFELPPGSRHDPCVAIRAVPVVEANAAIVAADAILMNRMARI